MSMENRELYAVPGSRGFSTGTDLSVKDMDYETGRWRYPLPHLLVFLCSKAQQIIAGWGLARRQKKAYSVLIGKTQNLKREEEEEKTS